MPRNKTKQKISLKKEMDKSRALSLFWKSHLLSTLICLSISDNLHPFLLPWFGLSFYPSSNLLIAFSQAPFSYFFKVFLSPDYLSSSAPPLKYGIHISPYLSLPKSLNIPFLDQICQLLPMPKESSSDSLPC